MTPLNIHPNQLPLLLQQISEANSMIRSKVKCTLLPQEADTTFNRIMISVDPMQPSYIEEVACSVELWEEDFLKMDEAEYLGSDPINFEDRGGMTFIYSYTPHSLRSIRLSEHIHSLAKTYPIDRTCGQSNRKMR